MIQICQSVAQSSHTTSALIVCDSVDDVESVEFLGLGQFELSRFLGKPGTNFAHPYPHRQDSFLRPGAARTTYHKGSLLSLSSTPVQEFRKGTIWSADCFR
jgi:hypothetical protein